MIEFAPFLGDQIALPFEPQRAYCPHDYLKTPGNQPAGDILDKDVWPMGCLALVGPKGCGKTHMAMVWANRAKACVLSIHQLSSSNIFTHSGPLVIDGIDALLTVDQEEVLFHLINRAAVADLRLLLTTRTAPALWPVKIADLSSRLKSLYVTEIAPPDEADLTIILQHLFRERSIRPSADLIDYLLKRMERSFAEAERLVKILDVASLSLCRPVGRVLAREIFEGLASEEEDQETG